MTLFLVYLVPMSGQHPKLEAWDKAVHEAIVAVEHKLEEQFGQDLPLRRNRPLHGETSNPQMDGLFNLGLVFTPGFGSERGRGYWMDLEIASRSTPTPEATQEYIKTCKELLEIELMRRFPHRKMDFVLDGGRWKLVGDFGLGEV